MKTFFSKSYWKLVRLNKKLVKLTPRESQILSLILANRTYGEIAAQLQISSGTVSKHASNIFKKLKIKDRAALEEQFYLKQKWEESQ